MSFEAQLQSLFQSADQHLPAATLDWSATFARARRERLVRMVSVAAVSLLLVGGGAWAASELMREPTVSLPPAHRDPSPTPEPSPTEQAEKGVDPSLVRPALLNWIKALSTGATEKAWSMLAERTQAYFNHDINEFAAKASEFSEGFGSWHTEEQAATTETRVLTSGGNEAAGVVTLYGQIEREGMSGWDANSVPFRVIGDDVYFDPFSSEVQIEPKEPTFNEEYSPDDLPDRFRAEFLSEVLQVNFFVTEVESSGRDATVGTVHSKVGEDRWLAFQPAPDSLEPGPAAVTIAAVDPEGGIATMTVLITVVP